MLLKNEQNPRNPSLARLRPSSAARPGWLHGLVQAALMALSPCVCHLRYTPAEIKGRAAVHPVPVEWLAGNAGRQKICTRGQGSPVTPRAAGCPIRGVEWRQRARPASSRPMRPAPFHCKNRSKFQALKTPPSHGLTGFAAIKAVAKRMLFEPVSSAAGALLPLPPRWLAGCVAGGFTRYRPAARGL